MTHLHTMCDTSEAAVAVTALRNGDMVAWSPGDRTLYRLALVGYMPDGLWLVDLTPRPGAVLELPTYRAPAESWLTGRGGTVPDGCWAGLRPILAALEAAEGPPVYNPEDAIGEANLRHG